MSRSKLYGLDLPDTTQLETTVSSDDGYQLSTPISLIFYPNLKHACDFILDEIQMTLRSVGKNCLSGINSFTPRPCYGEMIRHPNFLIC